MSFTGVAEANWSQPVRTTLRRQSAFYESPRGVKREMPTVANYRKRFKRGPTYKRRAVSRPRVRRPPPGGREAIIPRSWPKWFQPEIKHTAISNSVGFFARLNDTTLNGAYIGELDWPLTQSTSTSTITGAQQYALSAHFRIRMAQQTNAANNIQWKIMVVRTIGQPYTIDNQITDATYPATGPAANDQLALSAFLYTNPVTALYDIMSVRNEDTYANFRVLKTVTGTMKSDQIASAQNFQDINFKVKLGFQRHRTATASALVTGQMFIVFLANEGDCLAATATGISLQQAYTLYYTDY